MNMSYQRIIRAVVLVCCCCTGFGSAVWGQQQTDHQSHGGHTVQGAEIAQPHPAETVSPVAVQEHGSLAVDGGRDPHAYSGGYGFGPLPRLQMADQHSFGALLVNRLEGQWHDGGPPVIVYDLQAWYGRSYDRLLVKAEGMIERGRLEESHSEGYWSHALTAYWDGLLGVRYDGGEKPGQGWLACGLHGLTPYWVELKAGLYLGHTGQLSARIEAEYELLLSQRLVLQPRVETRFFSKRDASREIGAGLSELTAGLRMRYEFSREFAPYLGVEWYLPVGETRRITGTPDQTRLVAGLRLRF